MQGCRIVDTYGGKNTYFLIFRSINGYSDVRTKDCTTRNFLKRAYKAKANRRVVDVPWRTKQREWIQSECRTEDEGHYNTKLKRTFDAKANGGVVNLYDVRSRGSEFRVSAGLRTQTTQDLKNINIFSKTEDARTWNSGCVRRKILPSKVFSEVLMAIRT